MVCFTPTLPYAEGAGMFRHKIDVQARFRTLHHDLHFKNVCVLC